MTDTKKPRSKKAPRKKSSRKSSKARAPKRTQSDLYADATARIIARMQADDCAPWHKPWKFDGSRSTLPRNVRGNAYRGINIMLTQITAWERGYSSRVWLTFKQANEIAAKAMRAAGRTVVEGKRGFEFGGDDAEAGKSVGGIRKGQSKANDAGATEIVFWKKTSYKVEDEDTGEEKMRGGMLLKFYSVFNLEQCDEHVVAYVESKTAAELAKLPEFNPIEECERIVDGYDIDTSHGGDRAFYSPSDDRIQMPTRESFESPEAYYTVRFHEMGHSTGHASRLDRKGIANFDGFGSHQYADEELVAEFTACFLAAEAGIERTTQENSASYLKCWATKLAEDPKLVVFAAQRAQKAADLIMGRKAFDAAADTSKAA